MNRREFLHWTASATATAAGAASAVSLVAEACAAERRSRDAVHSRWIASIPIRDYLSREAKRITEGALQDYPSAAVWRQLQPEKRRQFFEMMGLEAWTRNPQRTPPPVTVTGVVDRPNYRIEKLYYESLPNLCVTANLYVPRTNAPRVPGVLYVCGHAQDQKAHYQAHARRFAELGLVCLIAETVQLGEVAGYHHGCYREGWWHWYSRGYTSAGIELLNGMRGLDLLAARPEVDPGRLGVTGISGGGAVTWWIAAGDERVRVSAPVCGTATLFSHIHDRTIDGHCDCMWWNNLYRWDLADVGALIAPRPLLIASADRDGIFTIESIRQVHQQLAGLYRKLGATANLRLVETPGGHSYHERSRTQIFSWFLQHLDNRPVPASRVGDIDDRPQAQESKETLRVYVSGAPPRNRIATIHDDFFELRAPPMIADRTGLEEVRKTVRDRLRRTTFGAFPTHPPQLDLQVEYEFDEGSVVGHRFAFTSEEGWRLHGKLYRNKTVPVPAPAVIALRLPGEGRGDTRSFLFQLKGPWARVELETRGTGDTSWGDDLQWHVRRACAWSGRTIASMRVWDALRALQAVRQLPGVDSASLSLAARGEMGVVALYTALMDGNVKHVFLESPPATQNAPGEKDGRGPALEMLHCLRVTDVAQVAGLLWPTELAVAGTIPTTYDWAASVYARLGAPGRFARLKTLSEWS
jgi:cephalosporin-C deacetylase-like acetyl esterase